LLSNGKLDFEMHIPFQVPKISMQNSYLRLLQLWFIVYENLTK